METLVATSPAWANGDELSAPLPPIDPALNQPSRIVVVASDSQLLRRSHFVRLAISVLALAISRRELINVIADALYGFKGKIVWPNGEPFVMPYIDDVFGNDGGFRWVSYFLKFAREPPRQIPQKRLLARLRVIDLYFRIVYPRRAELVAQ